MRFLPAVYKQLSNIHYKFHYHRNKLDNMFQRSNWPLWQVILGVNAAFYLGHQLCSPYFIQNHFTLTRKNMQEGRFYTIFTYSLTHANFMHLLLNSFPLLFFGETIEKIFGASKLLIVYIMGALVGGAFVVYSQKNESKMRMLYSQYSTMVMGSSGATSALLMYYILRFPTAQIYLIFFPLPAWVIGVFCVVSNFREGNTHGRSNSSHLGGKVLIIQFMTLIGYLAGLIARFLIKA